MNEILKIAAAAVICAVLYVIVKQERPEYAVFVQLGGIAVTGVMTVDALSQTVDSVVELMNKSDSYAGWISLLIKVAGTAVLSDIAVGICKDSGATALSNSVELAAKISVLVMSMPMIKEAAELAEGLLG